MGRSADRAFKSPLLLHVKQRERDGEKGVQARLVEAFAARGWGTSKSIVSYWCSGDRLPAFESQQQIEVVTDGAVTPLDWLEYRQRLHRRAKRSGNGHRDRRGSR